jgi:hypothetical protein
MGGGRGMGDDGFRIAQIVRDDDDLQRVQKPERRLLPARQIEAR